MDRYPFTDVSFDTALFFRMIQARELEDFHPTVLVPRYLEARQTCMPIEGGFVTCADGRRSIDELRVVARVTYNDFLAEVKYSTSAKTFLDSISSHFNFEKNQCLSLVAEIKAAFMICRYYQCCPSVTMGIILTEFGPNLSVLHEKVTGCDAATNKLLFGVALDDPQDHIVHH